MTRQKVLKEAQTRWGGKAYARDARTPSSPEQREAAAAVFQTAKERIIAIDAEITTRLAALDWYQALQAERRTLVRQKTDAIGVRLHHQFAVGFMDVGFHVKGEGDTWEEAFADADARAERERVENVMRRVAAKESKA